MEAFCAYLQRIASINEQLSFYLFVWACFVCTLFLVASLLLITCMIYLMTDGFGVIMDMKVPLFH